MEMESKDRYCSTPAWATRFSNPAGAVVELDLIASVVFSAALYNTMHTTPVQTKRK